MPLHTLDVWCDLPLLRESMLGSLKCEGWQIDPASTVKLLIDVPCGSAFALLEMLGSNNHTIVVTFNPCVEYWEDLWDLGPNILLVNPNRDDIIQALAHAAQDSCYRITPRRSTLLSPTQRKILRAIASAMTNREIAQQLHLQEQTIMNNVSCVLRNLGLEGRNEAMLYYWGLRDIFAGVHSPCALETFRDMRVPTSASASSWDD
jgi:DNA-binding CsgD family transcriptional regulator